MKMKKTISVFTALLLCAALLAGLSAGAFAEAAELPGRDGFIPDGICESTNRMYIAVGDGITVYDFEGNVIATELGDVLDCFGYLVVEVNGGVGLMNADGLMLIEPEFDHIQVTGDWAVCAHLQEGSEENYDVLLRGDRYMQYESVELVYIKNPAVRGSLGGGEFFSAQDIGGALWVFDREFNESFYDDGFNLMSAEEALELADDLRGYKTVCTDDGKYGIVDYWGDTLLEPVYDYIFIDGEEEEPLVEGYFAANDGEKLYIFNEDGSIAAEFEYSEELYYGFYGECVTVHADGVLMAIYHADGSITDLDGSLGSPAQTLAGGRLYLTAGEADEGQVLYDSYGSELLSACRIELSLDGHALAYESNGDNYTGCGIYMLY